MTLTAQHRDELFVFDHGRRRAVSESPRRTIRHVPALDGLRGIAVFAVVLFHFEVTIADRQVAKGGFLGVDAFFVLSGYLITSLLLAERRESGSIDLPQFLTRRAKRLFPALAAVLLAVCVFAAFFAIPDIKDQLRTQLLATLFYVANWQFIASGESYVEQFAYPSPLRHMWSLAIEEQFYVIWPLTVMGLMRWRKRPRAVMWTAIIAAVCSAVWMAALFKPGTDPSRVYYGTDTRMQSLLLGSALAAAIAGGFSFSSPRAKTALSLTAAAASAWLAFSWVRASYVSDWLYSGGFLLLAAAVCLVILVCVDGPAAGRSNPVAFALQWSPLRALGLISYGVYLIHWPVFVFVNGERTGLGTYPLLAVRLVVTLALSMASYRWIEQPIRRGDLLRRIHFRPAYFPAVAGAMVGVILLSTMGGKATLLYPGEVPIADRPVPIATGLPKLMMVGDSVGGSLARGFQGGTRTREFVDFFDQTQQYCEMVRGPRREANGKEFASVPKCELWREEWTAGRDVFKPDVVLLVLGPWEIIDRQVKGEWLTYGSPEYDAHLSGILREFVDLLSQPTNTIVFMTSPPLERPLTAESSPEWTPPQQWRIDHLNDLFRSIAATSGGRARVLEWGRHFCPNGTPCPQQLDGVNLRSDGIHFYPEGAEKVVPWIAEQTAQLAKGNNPDGVSGVSGAVPPGAPAPGPT